MLASESPYVSVIGSNCFFGTIQAGGTASAGASSLRIYVSPNAPVGVSLPLSITLTDSLGNTQTLYLTIFTTPQLNNSVITPRLTGVGSSVVFRAYFTGTNSLPCENGISSVFAVFAAVGGAQTYRIALTNPANSVGWFESSWTVPVASDWNVNLQVINTQTKTGLYYSVNGLSSAPFDNSAAVVLYYDCPVSEDFYCGQLTAAVTNAGKSCYQWKAFYRGAITSGALSSQVSKILFYYSPDYYVPSMSTDSSLRGAINTFISGGGRVLLAGGCSAYAMHNYGDVSGNRAFMADNFATAWVKQFYYTDTFTNIIGKAEDAVGAGLSIPLSYYSYYRDEIQVTGPGVACYQYDPASVRGTGAFGALGTAGIRTSGSKRNIMMAWDLSSYYVARSRLNGVVSNSIAYLFCRAPMISRKATFITDGDSDGKIEPSEQVNIAFRLVNSGLDATNVSVILSTTSVWCSVTSGTWSPGSMPEGSSSSNNLSPFTVQVAAGLPLGTALPLRLTIAANNGNYTNVVVLSLQTAMPVLTLLDYYFSDIGGNTNAIVEAGETLQLVVRLTNSGYRAENVVGRLSCANGYVTVVNEHAAFGDVAAGASACNSTLPFCVNISGEAAAATTYDFDLGLSYAQGAQTNHLALASGGYSVSPSANSWIDTTGGQELPLGDEGYATVFLPFTFSFYGQSCTSVEVDANGFISFGEVSGNTFVNSTLPSPGSPNAMVAPFWDDLDQSAGGLIRHKSFGAQPNRFWVVEWNAVPTFSYGGSLTFQIILYESGLIRCQYGPLSGTTSDGSLASIGIEDQVGGRGVQYSYLQAASVYPGLSIDFSSGPPFRDTDSDGLPDGFENFYFGDLSQTGSADSDADGLCNKDELKCATDPFNAASVLEITDAANSAGELIFSWRSVPGKTYSVQCVSNLLSGPWLNTNYVGASSSGFNTYTASVGIANGGFFRIVLP